RAGRPGAGGHRSTGGERSREPIVRHRGGRMLTAHAAGTSGHDCARPPRGLPGTSGSWGPQVRKRGTRSKVQNSATRHMARPAMKVTAVNSVITYSPAANRPNSTRNSTTDRTMLL